MTFLDECLQLATGVTGVLHIGAHDGGEADTYARYGINRITWVEANPALESQLRSRVEPLGHRVIMEAVGRDVEFAAKFYVASNGASSSLLRMDKHKEIWPDVAISEIITIPISTIQSLHYRYDLRDHNLWVLDIQGMEADALAGARDTLALADYILCEFTGPLYDGGATVDRIDSLLTDFTAVSGWIDRSRDFGEVLYRRMRRSGQDLMRLAYDPSL